MRRVVFVAIAVVVVAVMGFFFVRAFAVPKIVYVADYVPINANNQIKIQRLYSAEVDLDAFEARVENLLNMTDYTDEEILAAAIASGTPEFFPAFTLTAYRDPIKDEIVLSGYIRYEFADGQREDRFKTSNVSLEASVSAGELVVVRADVTPYGKNGVEAPPITKVHSERQAALDISGASSFEIAFSGESGGVTMQFVYNVQADGLMPKTVLEQQLLRVECSFVVDQNGVVEAEFELLPYSNLEELDA